MEEIKVVVNTDWWIFGATICSGVLCALATVAAVLISNRETRKQLAEQQEKYNKEKQEQEKRDKFVIVKPTLMLSTFGGILDRLIVRSDYNRELLLSGDDGFDFFDDVDKRVSQICRIIHIENDSKNDLVDAVIRTVTCLENKNTNEKTHYETNNTIKLLRANESIDIRMLNQHQFELILEMNTKKVPSDVEFYLEMEYSTMASQRIKYEYSVRIINDKNIEILKDESEIMTGDSSIKNIATSFRNMQDYISNVDRGAYAWEKMGQSQAKGLMSYMSNTVAEADEIKDCDSNV